MTCLQCVVSAEDADALDTNHIKGEPARVQWPEDRNRRSGITMSVKFLEDVVQRLENIVK